MANNEVFLFIGTYSSVADAQMDYDAVKELHRQHIIGTYDAAVVNKDAEGKVHVHKREKPTQYGAWTGIAVGALVGLLTPMSVVGSAVAGGAIGGLAGHFSRGMSRGDMKELGETLDEGQAALVVIGRSELAKQIEKATTRAQKRVEKRLQVDGKEFEKEMNKAYQVASS
jgi:uncharacterized membrane protein